MTFLSSLPWQTRIVLPSLPYKLQYSKRTYGSVHVWPAETSSIYLGGRILCILELVQNAHVVSHTFPHLADHYLSVTGMLTTTRLLRVRGLSGRVTLVSRFHTSYPWSAKVNKTFKLADIGEGITECEVIRWFVNIHPLYAYNVTLTHSVTGVLNPRTP